jgi:division protein CdvB (Snf7/Vps24/ESCRT-III family)
MQVSSSSSSEIMRLLRSAQAGGARAGGGQMPQPSAEMRQKMESQMKSVASELGMDANQFAQLGGKIREAASSAIQNSQEGSPGESVEQAINGVLEEAGVDPAAFKEQMGQMFEKMGMPKPGQGMPGLGGFGGIGFGQSNVPGQETNELLSYLRNMPVGSFIDESA